VRTLLATLRPAGNAGDQNLATGISVSFTNNTGSPTVALLATSNLSFVPSGLGSVLADQVVMGLAAEVSITGSGAIQSGTHEVVLTYVGIESARVWDLFTPGQIVDGLPRKKAPNGATWTGDVMDATTVRVEVDVLLQPGSSATLTVYEIRMRAFDSFEVRLGGAAGDVHTTGLAGDRTL
jgi:hypothetical protein